AAGARAPLRGRQRRAAGRDPAHRRDRDRADPEGALPMTLAIGIDLGGTNMRAALVDTAGTGATLGHEVKLALTERTPEAVADAVARAVTGLVAASGADGAPIGIGIAAMLKGTTGIVGNAPNPGWRDGDIG